MKKIYSRISFVLFSLLACTLTSCLSSGDDTIILESGTASTSGIPSDDLAEANPTITSATTSIPNIQYFIETEDDDAIVRIDMTGIQDMSASSSSSTSWLRLIGTAQDGQNVWLSVDDTPKGILVYNNSDSQQESAIAVDLVFLVDNSGSMGEEADVIAQDIQDWAQTLEDSGLDIRFGCVGYSENGRINGAINLTDASSLSTYLNRASGTSRTMGFSGSDAATLQTAASSYSVSAECVGIALWYADKNISFRSGANRIYVNFTDEPNQPANTSKYSTEYFKDQSNWSTSQGTVHTVFSGSTSFTETIGSRERPWRISEYTGGTTMYASSTFSGVTLSDLPVTGAMQNSYIIRFTNISEYMDGKSHVVKITVKSTDSKTQAEKTFYVTFGSSSSSTASSTN